MQLVSALISRERLACLPLRGEGGFFCYPYLRDDPLLQNLHREPQLQPLLEAAKQRHEAVKWQFIN